MGVSPSPGNKVAVLDCVTDAQSWRYKPGQYIAGASGCGLPALPHAGIINAPLHLFISGLPGAASIWTARLPANKLPADDPATGRPPPGQAILIYSHTDILAQPSASSQGSRLRRAIRSPTPILGGRLQWLVSLYLLLELSALHLLLVISLNTIMHYLRNVMS